MIIAETRCRACNTRLLDEELYRVDDNCMCSKCQRISEEAYRELLGYPSFFDEFPYLVEEDDDE